MKPYELVQSLNKFLDRVRIGLWLMPANLVGHEPSEAARLGIQSADLRTAYLEALPLGAKVANLSPERVLDAIEKVLKDPSPSKTILIYNLDLLLARLSPDQRNIVWMNLFSIMAYRPKAALITFPEKATNLLPSKKDVDSWRRDSRLAEII